MILVTGGAGYIGSHSVVELYNKGYDVLIADNFSNSSPSVLENLKTITGQSFDFIEVDICNYEKLKTVSPGFLCDRTATAWRRHRDRMATALRRHRDRTAMARRREGHLGPNPMYTTRTLRSSLSGKIQIYEY